MHTPSIQQLNFSQTPTFLLLLPCSEFRLCWHFWFSETSRKLCSALKCTEIYHLSLFLPPGSPLTRTCDPHHTKEPIFNQFTALITSSTRQFAGSPSITDSGTDRNSLNWTPKKKKETKSERRATDESHPLKRQRNAGKFAPNSLKY